MIASCRLLLTWIRRRLSPPWPLATRLAIGFSAASLLLLLATAALPYWALSYNLNREDDESLMEKAGAITELLSIPNSSPSASVDADELQRAAEPQYSEPIFVRVLRGSSNQIIVESKGMSQILPPGVFPPPVAYPWNASPPPLFDRHLHKRHMRMLAIAVPAATSHAAYEIQLGLDRTPEAELLDIYGNSLIAILAIGLLAAAVAGYAIAWRGLKPVRQMASAVAQIGSSNLGARLGVQDVPLELASLASAFNAMLSRLQESFDRLSQFSSDIAHELRTPVNNVRGLVDLTLAHPDRPAAEQAEQLSRALDECRRLSKLIDSLLFLARSENPQTQLQRQPLALQKELQSLAEFYEPVAAEHGIALQLSAPTPAQASLDRLLLQRAVSNLIENAIAHTPAGGTITLSAASHDGAAEITVADTGPGIPPAHLERIFDRFHRVDASRSKHTGGAGLGLAIVRSIAVMHGGRAEASNRPAGGAEFKLILPR